jgi:hypothetical protein
MEPSEEFMEISKLYMFSFPSFFQIIYNYLHQKMTTATKYPSLGTLALSTVNTNLSDSNLLKPQLDLGDGIVGKKISSNS